jgi:hypothetical protein
MVYLRFLEKEGFAIFIAHLAGNLIQPAFDGSA